MLEGRIKPYFIFVLSYPDQQFKKLSLFINEMYTVQ